MKITNWGNYPIVESTVISPAFMDELGQAVANNEHLIARGNGRCYGDSSLNSTIVSTANLNKILAFDKENGTINCQSGVLLSEILDVIVPAGFFLPVTPGTKFITVGGAIAADIHGKNHHIDGAFSEHLISFDLLIASGETLTCSPTQNSDLFWATCGGMGLTGIILKATFRPKAIETSYIRQESIKAIDLDEVMDLFEASAEWTYSVAWLDCLSKGSRQGRSILFRGAHAKIDELRKRKQRDLPLKVMDKVKFNIAFYLPSFVLNSLTVKTLNFLYYRKQIKKMSRTIIDYDAYFYPLDFIHNWNRMYGRGGFTQYQLVLPKESSKEGLKRVLHKIRETGQGSFLTVLKLFGKSNPNAMLSFPGEGYTLALDFKISQSVLDLLEQLDQIVLNYGGRVYLAKDVRMKHSFFGQSYPKKDAFMNILDKINNGRKFQSLQSNRIGLSV